VAKHFLATAKPRSRLRGLGLAKESMEAETVSLITKLNPKSPSLEVGGSFASLSQSDIAAAMTGLDALQEALIRFYWLGDIGYAAYLRDQAIIELCNRGVEGELAFKMGSVIVDDLANSTCSACNGTGENSKKRVCGHCDGSGKKGLSDRELAKRLEVPKTSFQRRYKEDYKVVYARFEFIANATARQISHKLG